MIRINLLAVRRAKKRDAGERQLVVMGMAVMVAVAAMAFFYVGATGELDGLKRANASVRSDIDRLKADLGDYDKIKDQRQELLKQQKTIQALQAGRTGPLYLMRELSAFYEAFRTGTAPSVAPLALQYGDFALWQRDVLRGERLESLLSYWRDQLRDAPAVLEMPTDRPRPATPNFEGDTRARLLSLSLLERLRALARANDATLFMTLLAAFDILLSRYSGQDDVVVGSPIAGRAHEGAPTQPNPGRFWKIST